MKYQRRSRLPGGEAASSKSRATDSLQHSGVATWKRRQDNARRMEPLDCGCPDPWPCRCTNPPLSEQRIDAGRDAATRLLGLGYVPLVEIEVLKALWRRGGVERELAESLFAAMGGEIA